MVVPEFQREVIRDLYRTDADGRRIVRQAVISWPRRSGKSLMVSALCLAHLCGPEAIPRGLCVSASADRTMAAYVYDEMRAFIMADEELRDRIAIRDFLKTMEDVQTGSVYRALSADARKAHGLGPHFVVADETSQWVAPDLWNNLTSGQGAVREPLAIAISTRSANRENLTEQLIDYGEKVRAGVMVDPSFTSHVRSAPLEADWRDPAVHRAVNPAIAAGWLDPDDLRIACEQAMAVPAKVANFRLLRLNSPVPVDQRWLHIEDWDSCAKPIELADFRGKRAIAAIDLGGASDLCGVAVYILDDHALFAWGMLPESEMAARETTDGAPYGVWAKQGHIIPVPGGRVVHKAWVAAKLRELASELKLECVVYDRWGIKELEAQLRHEGVRLPPLIEFGQGFQSMGPAVEAVERAVLSGELQHDGGPLLRWCIFNAAVETDSTGARKIFKSRCRGRVDPLIAAIMCLGHAAKMAPKPRLVRTGMLI